MSLQSKARTIAKALVPPELRKLIRQMVGKEAATEKARTELLKLVPKGGVCAEIGVWKGDFSQRILQVATPSLLHLIDPWQYRGEANYVAAWYGGLLKQEGGQAAMDSIYSSVQLRFHSETTGGTVKIHRASSVQAANEFPPNYFDFVYIDGDHLYEFVKQDLMTYAEKMRSGGVLAGDDYGEKGWWDEGVTRAVDEFKSQPGFEMIFLRETQFAFRKS